MKLGTGLSLAVLALAALALAGSVAAAALGRGGTDWPGSASTPRATTSARLRPGSRRRTSAAAAPAGPARRDRRLLADLPARGHRRGQGARRLLRHDHVRPHRGDRRRQRQAALALHAADLRALCRIGADHDDDADRRPGRTAIYAGGPDGRIRKLAVATGKELWSTSITRDPTHEKLASALNYSSGLVLAATDGYIGDAPPYQGHVVTLNPANGRIVGVWNSLCSDRHGIIQPSTCPASDSAIWGRSAPVVDPATGDLLVATGNGPFDGKTNWGDSVLVLSPDGSSCSSTGRRRTRRSSNSQRSRPRLDRARAARGRLLRPGRQGRPAPAALALAARRRRRDDRR